jgi:hypothetical protein
MSEPTFIPSSEPFKVSMPEGSTVARSQSANVGDDVRRVLADDEFVNVEDNVEEHSLRLQSSGGVKVANLAKLGSGVGNASKKPLFTKSSPQVAASTADSKEEERLALLEMDFPARVVHLKIENDTVRKQINELNAQIKPGR